MNTLLDFLTFAAIGCGLVCAALAVLILMDNDIIEHIKDDWRNS